MDPDDQRLDEARDVRRLFDGGRLRIARELRGFSQSSLAELANLSGAAVGQFEKGASTPNARSLDSLSAALRFPIAYFRNDRALDQVDKPAFFRSSRSTSVKDQKRARAFAELVRDFTLGVESEVELPRLDIPRFPTRCEGLVSANVEAIAQLVREEWSLSTDEPIEDVVVLLERHGVVVTRAEFEAQKIDAFSVAFDDRPVVVLCSDKGLRDRSRFDASHELGHLVMHSSADCGKKVAESQANQFAAAFLMPRDGIMKELPDRVDWIKLIQLKRRWGVSIGALLVRAKTLGTISNDVYVQAIKAMSARGWKTREPEPLGIPESPQLLYRAVKILREELGRTTDDLENLTGIPTDQIERIYASTAPARRRVQL